MRRVAARLWHRNGVGDTSKYEMEIEVLQKYSHPNIVQYLGVQRENRNLRIFLEVWSPGGRALANTP